MIESLRTTQIAFFRFATPCRFFRGSTDKVQKVSVQGFMQEKILWNHLWEHRFYVPDPRVFPPPDDHFWHRRPKTHFMTGLVGQPSNKDFPRHLNTCLREWKLLSLYMFHPIIFLLLIVSSFFCNFNRCAICFQSLMDTACRSSQNTAARIKRFWILHIVINPLNKKINIINYLLCWSV